MKKLFSFLVLGFFIFQISNPLVIYASLEDTLEELKQETSAKLDTLEVIADKTIATLEAKTSNQEIESQLEEKSQEIEVYLEEVQAEVQDASSQTEVTQILEEAKKVVTLKVVAGATEYSDIEEGLPKGEALTPSEKEIALETLQESIEQETTFTLMIATKYNQSQVQTLLSKFDAQIEVKLLYISDDTNYFELTISQQSIFAQEILQDIQDGTIPESFVGIEIIQPEVFILEALEIASGENIDSTWGVKQYRSWESGGSNQGVKVKVGIVDTGIQLNHPDLAGNISPTLGYDFVNDDSDASDDQGHGTHVAGTIGAMNNGSGIIGVNPNVELVPLKICNASGFCPSYAIIKAIDYAKTHHIPVLNMSLGGRGTVTDNPICAGIDALTAQGTIVVSAAGNSNVDTSTFVPGGCPSALTVGAYDQLQKRASFSNYGAKVDVSAPGVSIYSTHLNSGYKNLSGTSMATPHIVGVISLLKSLKPSITRSEVISLFNQHKVLLNAEVGKSIASGVDVVRTIQTLTLTQTENQTPPPVTDTDESEEVSSALSTPTQTPATDVILNPNIEFVPNQEAKALEVEAKNAELIAQAQQETETVGIANVVLDFLGLGSRTEINSLGENAATPEEQVLPLTQEPYKGAYQIADVQYFDENGNTLSDVAIANVEDEGEVVTGTLLEVGQEPVYIDNGEITENQSTDTLNEEVGNTVEILIDGAQNPIAINSIDEEELVETPLVEYIPQDITQVEGDLIEPPVEHLDYSYESEVFVDGATSENIGNSVGGEGYDPLSLENQEMHHLLPVDEEMNLESIEEVPQILQDGSQIQDTIPTIVDIQLYQAKEKYQSLLTANTYQYTFSTPGALSMRVSSKYFYVTGVSVGTHEIYAHKNGIHTHTFRVTVLPWPQIQEYNITVPELETVKAYLPNNSYSFVITPNPIGKVSITNRSGVLDIYGLAGGALQYTVSETWGEMAYIPKYRFNITVIPKPPIVETYEVYVGRKVGSQIVVDGNVSVSQTGIINLNYSNGRYSFTGLSAGDVEVYYKNRDGRHTHTVKVKVLPIPLPLTYSYNLTVGDDASVTLPEPMANYILEIENTGLFDNYKVKKGVPSIVSGTNSFYMRTDDAGITKVHLIDPVTRFDKYLIVLDVKAREAAYSLNVTDKIHIAYNDNRNYYNQNPELFKFSGGDITGLKAGVGQIISRYEGRMRTIYTITVNPIPEPKQITCNTLAGKDCWVGVNYDRYSYTVSGPTVLDRVERTGSGIRVRTKGSGIITLYLKSVTGNYTSHVLTVNVASKPPLEYECTIPVGYSCLSYEDNQNAGYTFTSTNGAISNVSLLKFPALSALSSPYYQYKITGLKQGTGDVYIYRYNDHIATVHTTILPPVTPLSLQTSNRTIKEGEVIRGTLSGGAAPYSVKSIKYVDAQGNETTSTDLYTSVGQTTGEVTITAKQRPGNYTIELKDKYDQTVKFGVTVLDAYLSLSQYQLTLNTGDNTTVSIKDYYVALEPIEKSNNGVSTIIIDQEDISQPQKPKKYLQIFAKEIGTTLVSLKDAQGNTATLQVTVTGGMQDIINNGITKARITDFIYQDAESVNGLGAIYFSTEGTVQEVGIQYKNSLNQEVRETLDIEADGIYITGIDKLDCSTCYNSIQPYVIDTDGNTIYYASVNIPSQYVSILGSTGIANLEVNQEIVINGIIEDKNKYIYESTVKFVRNLRRGFIKIVGDSTGYIDGTTRATLDAVEDLKNTPRDIIELITKAGKKIKDYYNQTADIQDDINAGITAFGELAVELDEKLQTLAEYYNDLGQYDKDWVDSYVGVTMALSIYGPSGKLKVSKTLTRTAGQVDRVIHLAKKTRFLRELNIHSHITAEIMTSRGWTTQKMRDVISNPYKIGKSIDNLDGKTGVLGEPATAYFFSTNQYIVINNKTSKVIQISNLNEPDWAIDARIYDIK